MFDLDTPITGSKWRELSDLDRLKKLSSVAKSSSNLGNISIKSCNKNGQVFVEFMEPISASNRSTILLDLEMELKKNIDDAITIWNQPLGDKSSLRRLRGVIVKS